MFALGLAHLLALAPAAAVRCGAPVLAPTVARHAAPLAVAQGIAAPSVTIRAASEDELDNVAALQLSVFMPPDDPPALLPIFGSLFAAGQRNARAELHRRLVDDLRRRRDAGSQHFVALSDDDGLLAAPDAPYPPEWEVAQYAERDLSFIGSVEISTREFKLPTHSLCDGVYISHMAVAVGCRRRGIGKQLLRAAQAEIAQRGEFDGVWLHVEKTNDAAIRLYEQAGFNRCAETPIHATFTRALDLEHRDPMLMRMDPPTV